MEKEQVHYNGLQHKDFFEDIGSNLFASNFYGIIYFSHVTLVFHLHWWLVALLAQGHQATVEFLLSRKADVLSTNDLGGGAVSAAATTGHQEVLRQLVAARGNVEESDDRGRELEILRAVKGRCELYTLEF